MEITFSVEGGWKHSGRPYEPIMEDRSRLPHK